MVDKYKNNVSLSKSNKDNLMVAMTIAGIDDMDMFIVYLLDYTKLIAEDVCKVSLDNIFINKMDTHIHFNDRIVLRVYWSADNYPRCSKVYANAYSYDLSKVLCNYREWKLNMLLSK